MLFPNQEIPAPLFRDPIYDGASDPTVLWVEEEGCYYMFYTQRRATEFSVSVSYIHGSAIGMASSRDGTEWLYRGTVPGLYYEPGHNTFWAPEVVKINGIYHMYVSYITGVPTDWNHGRKILHYRAENIWSWELVGEVELDSARVIDACLLEPEEGVYRMWYKDEEKGSMTYTAVSHDLHQFKVMGQEISDCAQEGPNVFAFGGKTWLIADYWKGLAVYRRGEADDWIRCKDLLSEGSDRELDGAQGHHADIVVENESAYIFYFCHPFSVEEKENRNEIDGMGARSVIQAASLFTDGVHLYCERGKLKTV